MTFPFIFYPVAILSAGYIGFVLARYFYTGQLDFKSTLTKAKEYGQMTERDYIAVSDKTILTNVINILREIVPDNSEIIDKKELGEVMSKLCEWRDKHFETIKIKE